jgi:peroxiredoxin
MKRTLWILGLVLILMPVASAHAGDRALCAVCALNGETGLEDVVATREFAGETVSFCSAKCVQAFDVDPAAYVFHPGPAPTVTLASLGGQPVALAPAPGRVVLVDFWAVWCKPCVKAMPEIDALYREYQARGLDVVGVSVDTGAGREKQVRKFLDKRGVSYPTALDREEAPAWEAFHVKVLPSMFLIDGKGVIVRRWTGVVDIDQVRAAVESLLAQGVNDERN